MYSLERKYGARGKKKLLKKIIAAMQVAVQIRSL